MRPTFTDLGAFRADTWQPSRPDARHFLHAQSGMMLGFRVTKAS